jgi:tight adherence protein C
MATEISIAVFVAVTSLIIWFGYHRYVLAGRVYENLETPAEFTLPVATGADPEYSPLARAAEFVGTKVPPSAETASALERKLLAAGYRNRNAVAILYGLKLMIVASVAVLMILFAVQSTLPPLLRLLAIGIAILAGYRLPEFFLSKRITRRQKALRKGLPDALDLIVVCAEAGLTIDRSFKNVSQQLGFVHPVICEEFSLFATEISAGLRRKEALDNIANRTQEIEIRKFVAVLTQADRFGTSMADALRTHADYLRTRRRQDAEEMASKVGVKLIFPIFFFIMPCMLLVTVGPAAITITRQLSGLFAGGH